MRRFSALVVAASVLAAITACSTAPSTDTCETGVNAGNASKTVQASGDIGAAPTVTFPEPLITAGIERSTITAGDGAALGPGQPVILEATILNGTDGSVLQQTAYATAGGSLFTVGDSGLPALGTALECATVGSRVAVVAPAAANSAGGEATSTDSVVYVVDLLKSFPARADGADELPVPGMPSVVSAPDGTPGITLPSGPVPTDYRQSLLQRGTGAEIAADDLVVAKVTAVNWDTKTLSQSTWSTGSTSIIDLSATTVSEGLKQAITGEKVGSRVLAVVPASLATTSDGAPAATLVYVVDILGTVN
ncbi:MAG: peptidylprolyl isomerase [Burkholderiaceae bacterium]|nr:peptidylprolyl isomerase [Microbacteriaceae bacterium]